MWVRQSPNQAKFYFFLTEETKTWTAKCWNYREEYSWKATAMKDEAFVFPLVTLICVNIFCKKMAQWLKHQEKHFWRGCSLMTPRPNTTATLKHLCVLKGALKRCCLFAWRDGRLLLNLGTLPRPLYHSFSSSDKDIGYRGLTGYNKGVADWVEKVVRASGMDCSVWQQGAGTASFPMPPTDILPLISSLQSSHTQPYTASFVSFPLPWHHPHTHTSTLSQILSSALVFMQMPPLWTLCCTTSPPAWH